MRNTDLILAGILTDKKNWNADLTAIMPGAVDRMVAAICDGQRKSYSDIKRLLAQMSEECPELRREQRTALRRWSDQVSKGVQAVLPTDPQATPWWTQ